MTNNKFSQSTKPNAEYLLLVLLLFVSGVSPMYVWAQDKKKGADLDRYNYQSEAFKGRIADSTANEIYNGWQRSSQYITTKAGIKLAIDIIRPTKNGILHTERLPVIWQATMYQRASKDEKGNILSIVDTNPGLQRILKQGYVVASLDQRGHGASFGTNAVFGTMPSDAEDFYDVNEWLASQTWSNGKTGMFGCSGVGRTQWAAAASGAPSLKAIIPDSFPFGDMGPWRFNGMNVNFYELFAEGLYYLDVVNPAPPVDEDRDSSMLKAAIEEHKANKELFRLAHQETPYYDSWSETLKSYPHKDAEVSTAFEAINKNGIAVYLLGGFFDPVVTDVLYAYNSLKSPKRLTIGPWEHCQSTASMDEFDWAAEHLRWYDYWLKGINNGVMDEEPVRYHTTNAPDGNKWKVSQGFPLSDAKVQKYYFDKGTSGTVQSVNDGSLSVKKPRKSYGQDDYKIDYTVSTSQLSTDSNGAETGTTKPVDFTPLDAKSLTYTTPPLSSDMVVTGMPVVHLWLTSSAKEVDLYAYLEEVDENGISTKIANQSIKSSWGGIRNAPHDTMRLPFHGNLRKGDELELSPDKPIEIAFFLVPTSHVFKKGNCLRITINNADNANKENEGAPTVTLYRNAKHASHISLTVEPEKGK
ncbi:MAG: CocE/NonD family hydrolase [Tannerellaceae bacterium]|jgi:putative CocE/NonD family hydrolase|nr:CocE/NonD family hydrolase [Tannerellaceae bacterium]